MITGIPTGTITLTPDPVSIEANGTSTTTITSSAIKDASNAVVPTGTLITVATDAGTINGTDADGATAGFQVATNASGIVSFVLKSSTTITPAVNVTATSVAGNATGAAVVAFTAPPAASFTVETAATAVAGVAQDVTVTAKDTAGNTMTAYVGTITFTSTDTQAVLPADYTFVAGDNGVHIFTTGLTLKTAGNQTVTVTSGAVTGSATVAVSPSETAAKIILTAPTPISCAAPVGTPTLTATIQDAFGNTVTTGADSTLVVTFGVDAALTYGNLGGAATATATAAGGVATTTLTAVEHATGGPINCTANATGAGGALAQGTAIVTTVPKTLTKLVIKGSPYTEDPPTTTNTCSNINLTAMGTFSDGSEQNLTTLATWAPSGNFTTPGVFTPPNTAQDVDITATYASITTAIHTVTVKAYTPLTQASSFVITRMVGETVDFADAVIDGCTPYNYTLSAQPDSCTDALTGSVLTPTCIGSYTVQVTDSASTPTTVPVTINVVPCDATASFTVGNYVYAAETGFGLTDKSIAPKGWAWLISSDLFGDVGNSAVQNPPPGDDLYSFVGGGLTGVFNVTLTVTGTGGCPSTYPEAPEQVLVYVNGAADSTCGLALNSTGFTAMYDHDSDAATDPIVVPAAGVPIGTLITFTPPAQTVNGSAFPATATMSWDFNNDGTADVTGSPVTAEVTYAYTAAGTYTGIVTITDGTCTWYEEVDEVTVNCDVTANFTANPSSITLPATPTVTFTNTSTGGTDTTTYAWDFNNDGTTDDTTTGTEAPDTYTYPSTPGTYTAKMTATGTGGCTTVKTVSITVNSQPPVNVPSVTAAFSADKTSAKVSETVKFTDASTASYCTLSSWSWTFGDGASSTVQNPEHAYTTPGVYTVTLTASCSGASDTETRTSYITVIGCMASFTAAGTGNALEVKFDGSASSNAVTYEWDFGDGTGGEGVTPTHIYSAAGTYTVKLKVTGADENCFGVTERNVIVSENCLASAYFTVKTAASASSPFPFPFPLPGNVRTAEFDAEGSTGDTFAWTFGDGNTGTGKQATHTYAAAGTYNVTLTVTAAAGCSASTTQSVNIGASCVADAGFTAFVTENSLKASFSADSSTGTSYAWEFGDGATASGMSVNHTYAAGGTYEVKLTVTSGACTDTTTQSVSVQTEACPAVAKFTFADDGLTVTFDTTGSVGTLLFDYGDGSTGTETTHTYAAEGTYTVKLTAKSLTDTGNECSAFATANVTVSTCAARAAFTASNDGLTVTFDTTGSAGTLSFDYGDGQTGADTTHTYSAPGTYTVVLTATADDGCFRTRSLSVTVCSAAAAFTAQPVAGTVPLTVNFDAGESVGETFAWDFGDGSVGSGETASHEYAAAGTYTVVLTVSDGNCTATEQAVITVNSACTLVAAFTALPGDDAMTVVFDASASIGDSFAWNFGDGKSGSGKIVSHAYAAEGTYVVTLTVSGCNTTATLEKTVVVVSPSPNRPDAPVLTEPADGMVNVILQALLKSGAFHSPLGAGHGRSVWQIALDPDFTEMVFSLMSDEYLTSLTLPEFILNPGTSYYWRVRYLDANGLASDWSEVFTFVTVGTNDEDLNANGIPDSQEVANPPYALANGLWVKILTGEGYIGVEGLEGVEEIGWLKWLDVRTVEGLPGIKFPWGQFTWKLKATAKTVKVKIHFSAAMPEAALWYNYNLQRGWRDLTDTVEFASDMKSVTITFTDGGADDADGVENGWIVDPAGFGVVETTTECCEDKSDGGSCFIETAASGKVYAGLALILITGLSLLAFRKSQR
ncbi:MAG: PKD domain-containing protein [Desulfococcaceae bacterium]